MMMSERYLYKRELGDTRTYYINAKCPGEMTTTVMEVVGRREAQIMRDELKEEFPEAILWVVDVPTPDWKRENEND